MVGRRSIVRTGREMTLPCLWLGFLTKSGTGRTQPAVAGLTSRRSVPGIKLSP